MDQLTIIDWSKGNPGALRFLVELHKGSVAIALAIYDKLEKAPSIRGTNLYVLWSDICNQDMVKVETLCRNCPTHILEDACSRQDRSGRNLVEPYLTGSAA